MPDENKSASLYVLEVETIRREATVVEWQSSIPFALCRPIVVGVTIDENGDKDIPVVDTDVEIDRYEESMIEILVSGYLTVFLTEDEVSEIQTNKEIYLKFDFLCEETGGRIENYKIWVNSPAKVLSCEKN